MTEKCFFFDWFLNCNSKTKRLTKKRLSIIAGLEVSDKTKNIASQNFANFRCKMEKLRKTHFFQVFVNQFRKFTNFNFICNSIN